MTCKRRKKKCDEAKPRCGDCARLCLDCAWPAQRKLKATPRDSNSWKEHSWMSADNCIDLDMERPRSLSHSTSTTSAESNVDFNIADLLCQMSTSILPNAPEGEFVAPLDDSSWDISQDVNWLDMLPQTPPVSASPPEDLISESLSLYIPSLTPDITCPRDKALINHYSTIVASVLSRCPNASVNPYLTYLLPMAMSNQLVFHCVLALSATHWQRLQPQMKDKAFFHQGRATQSLANLLPHVDTNSIDIALVSCLLLCMTELFDGTSTRWKLHLQGAKRLFNTLKLERGDSLTGHYKFLTRLSRFLDSATTTSTCKPPLIDDKREAVTFESAPITIPESDGQDAAVYGIPRELFHIVDRISDLASKRGTRVDDGSESVFRQEAKMVQNQLDNWAYDYGGLAGAVASLSPSNEDVLHATTAYEWALRLRLHQVVEGYSLNQPLVSQCVERILESSQKIRYGSSLESCLLFPLVMAGGACDSLEQRIVVQDRLMVMERTCGFGYIHQARELVETVWKRRDTTETRVNWARIRYEEMDGLALF